MEGYDRAVFRLVRLISGQQRGKMMSVGEALDVLTADNPIHAVRIAKQLLPNFKPEGAGHRIADWRSTSAVLYVLLVLGCERTPEQADEIVRKP